MHSLTLSQAQQVGWPWILGITTAALWLLAALLVLILLAHTAHVLGRQALLYRKKPPVPGWSKQFYPVTLALIALLIVVILLMNHYKNGLHLLY